MGASIDESEADDGWSWGKGACPDNSEMKREMRAVNANLKAARWDLIYGCASQVSLRARVEFMDQNAVVRLCVTICAVHPASAKVQYELRGHGLQHFHMRRHIEVPHT